MSALEACDLLRFAAGYAERLEDAAAVLSKHPALVREREWLAQAKAVVSDAAAAGPALLERARELPELPELRSERAGAAQNEWVDALEKLLAGITFHVSGRAPIIEALFPHQKLQPLRKVPSEAGMKFQQDFEKRAKSGYVSRMLASEDFTFAVPVLEKVRGAFASWQGCFGDGALSPEEAQSLRSELSEAGAAVERTVRQARLLAEAALIPVQGVFEDLQLSQKPKKRVSKAADAAVTAPPAVSGEPEPEAAQVAEPEAAVAASAGAGAGAGAGPEAGLEAREPAASKKKAGKARKAKVHGEAGATSTNGTAGATDAGAPTGGEASANAGVSATSDEAGAVAADGGADTSDRGGGASDDAGATAAAAGADSAEASTVPGDATPASGEPTEASAGAPAEPAKRGARKKKAAASEESPATQPEPGS